MFSTTYIRQGFLVFLGAGLLVLGSFSAWGQDPQFSHFFSSSLYHNPAFTGFLGTGRATAVYRSQWPGLANINTILLSADGLLAEEKVGLGCIISYHKQDGWYGRTEVAVPLAYRVMAPEWTLSMAVQPGITSRSVGGLSGMTFVDQYAALNNGTHTPNSADPLASASFTDNYFSVGAGFLFDYFRSADYPRLWIGGSAHQGAYPLGYDVKFQPSHWSRIRKSIQAGVQFLYGDANGQQNQGEKREKALSLIANIRNQYGNTQLDLMIQYAYSPVLFQAGCRSIPLSKIGPYFQQDALFGSIGYRRNRIQVIYTYDLTISGLKAGSHEIGIAFGLSGPLFKFGADSATPCPYENDHRYYPLF